MGCTSGSSVANFYERQYAKVSGINVHASLIEPNIKTEKKYRFVIFLAIKCPSWEHCLDLVIFASHFNCLMNKFKKLLYVLINFLPAFVFNGYFFLFFLFLFFFISFFFFFFSFLTCENPDNSNKGRVYVGSTHALCTVERGCVDQFGT